MGKNDVREYIREINFTEAGEVAENKAFSLNEDAILEASRYDGFINCLSGMEFTKLKETGYIPSYKRTNLTDDIHDVFSFRTDYEILSPSYMKKIFAITKKS